MIITGLPVDSNLAQELREATKRDWFVKDWCSPTGEIGHIDAVQPGFSSETISRQLQELAESFPTLNMAVSFMTNPPGTPGHPVVSFLVKAGKSKRDANAHVGHGPPRRVLKAQ